MPTLPPGVIITDPALLAFVFRHEDTFQKGRFFTDRAQDLFGHGIVNADGPLWKTQRKAGLQFLSAENLHVLTEVALPRYLQQAVDLLNMRAREGAVVDLQAVMLEVTTQVMGKMAYNMEMHADDEFTVAFEHASGAIAERFQNPLWFLTERAFGRRLGRSLAVVKSYGQRIVASAVAERSEKEDACEDKLYETSGSLIRSLLDALEDQDLVADAALNFLSAGRDTVAQALTWTFYLLMRNPTVVKKLRAAVHYSKDSSIRPLSPAHLTPPRIPYALAVFYEALRLYPPIPFEIKQAQHDTTLPDGTFLPASSVVVWCAWAMNRSRMTWGDDAEVFRPERWLCAREDGSLQVVSRSASEFPVFNGGPRLCLGKRMAESVAVQVVAMLVDRFDFVPGYQGERVSKSSLTLPMEGGLPVYVKERP